MRLILLTLPFELIDIQRKLTHFYKQHEGLLINIPKGITAFSNNVRTFLPVNY